VLLDGARRARRGAGRIEVMQSAYDSSRAEARQTGRTSRLAAGSRHWQRRGKTIGMDRERIASIGLLAVMAVGLMVLARFWPRSSRRTGYRITGQDVSPDDPPVPEDDEARWRWKDR